LKSAGYYRIRLAADRLLEGQVEYFGTLSVQAGTPPDWFSNPYTGMRFQDSASHWSQLSDFDAKFGDIKVVWEPSRFAWCLLLAQAYLVSGEKRYLEAANAWIADWLAKNPYNAGPNWMCGQETSIRLIHVLLADALLAGHSRSKSTLDEFVLRHCERISTTTAYAIAQDNNHSISEAVGLFVGGSWLITNSTQQMRAGERFRTIGRRMLERQVAKLIMEDGSFAQYSTNYHRLLLDTLCIAEWWRSRSGQRPFSSEFYSRVSLATEWLLGMLERGSGDVPNIGANDGAHVFQFCKGSYRDYRPTLQLAAAMFLGKTAIPSSGPWDSAIHWLNIDMPTDEAQVPKASLHAQGGFGVLGHADITSFAVCRGVSRRFRPSQADALHVDLWWDGENVLRGAGTYSYAADAEDIQYFRGTSSHNTVQFDGRDQMRSIGRFLFADWLEPRTCKLAEVGGRYHWTASYTDYQGCSHHRTLQQIHSGWRIVDRISGPFEKAVLRWRLHPAWDWKLTPDGVRSSALIIELTCSSAFDAIVIEDGLESRHYLEKTPLPVLAATVTSGDCEIETTIRANSR
jgi:hypothetical protein